MNKGNTMYVLLAVLVVLIFALLWYSEKTGKSEQALQTPVSYETTSDLDNASKELDATDLNQMDPELKQIDVEANF
jgi:hypothetical protein